MSVSVRTYGVIASCSVVRLAVAGSVAFVRTTELLFLFCLIPLCGVFFGCAGVLSLGSSFLLVCCSFIVA